MSKTTAAKLIIHQRTDWEQTLTPPVLPLPDASWGARCQIRDAVGVLLAEPLATVEPDGDIRLELGRSLTNIRPSSSHAYDVLLESPGGDRDKFFSGQVTVVGTITQWGVVPPVIPGAPPDPIPAWLSGIVNGAIANHNANLAAHPGLARIVVPFSWGDASPKAIATVTGVVVTSSIVVMTGINSVSQLRLGDAAANDRLMSASQNLPSEPGEYETNPGHNYVTATPVSLTISLGTGTTQGGGFVILEVI